MLRLIFIDGVFKTWVVQPELYTHHIEEMMEQAIQHGIWVNFEKSTIHFVGTNAAEREINANEINMEQLKYILWGYQLGNIFAFCFFCTEIVLGKWMVVRSGCKRKRNNE